MSTEKRESASPGSGLTSALSEAQSIVEAARTRAAEIVAEADKRRSEARDAGYREGYSAGLKEASEKAVRLMKETSALSERLSEEAAKLALAISEAVIGEHIKVAPEAARNMAQRALQEAVIGDKVTLVVNPADEPVVRSSLAQLRRIAGNAAVNIESDPSYARGGCMVRTDFGEIDATIETLLGSMQERLGLNGNG